MKDISGALTGETLLNAKAKDWKKLDAEYEKFSFKNFQRVGYKWEPTREILLNFLDGKSDADYYYRKRFSSLTKLCVANLIGFLALFIYILLR